MKSDRLLLVLVALVACLAGAGVAACQERAATSYATQGNPQ